MSHYDFLINRNRMFDDRRSYWGRNRLALCELLDIMEFPDSAYHDPGTIFCIPRAALLKRKYLIRLKQELMKLQRRDVPVFVAKQKYWALKKCLWEKHVQSGYWWRFPNE